MGGYYTAAERHGGQPLRRGRPRDRWRRALDRATGGRGFSSAASLPDRRTSSPASTDKAPYAAAFVLGVTYLVLLYTFRSVFIPLKAVVVNILSLTASFGALVFVFQDGNLSEVLNFAPLGFVDATLPILIFCTIFGVSMDYEVFLLSRIREAYENATPTPPASPRGWRLPPVSLRRRPPSLSS